jgi:excisionase family DNA binding protein
MAKIISRTEAAEILGVSRQRILALIQSGTLASSPVFGKPYPYADSVEEYKNKLHHRLRYAPKFGRNVPTYLKKKKRKIKEH